MSAQPQALALRDIATALDTRTADEILADMCKPQALATPTATARLSLVAADIAAEAATDALIDAQDELHVLQNALAHLKEAETNPNLKAFLYTNEQEYRAARSRLGEAIGRKFADIHAMECAAAVGVRIDMRDISKPVAPGAGVTWTGD